MKVWAASLTLALVGTWASITVAQDTATITSEKAFINDVFVASGLFDVGDTLEGEFKVQCKNTAPNWEYCNIDMQMEDWDYDVIHAESDYYQVLAGQTVTWTPDRIGPDTATVGNTEYYASACVDIGGGPTLATGAIDFSLDY